MAKKSSTGSSEMQFKYDVRLIGFYSKNSTFNWILERKSLFSHIIGTLLSPNRHYMSPEMKGDPLIAHSL